MTINIVMPTSRTIITIPAVTAFARAYSASSPVPPSKSGTIVNISQAGKDVATAEVTDTVRIKAEKLRSAIKNVDFTNISGAELTDLASTLYQAGAISPDDAGLFMGMENQYEQPHSSEEKFDVTKRASFLVDLTTNAARTDPTLRTAVQFADQRSNLLSRMKSFAASDRLEI